MGTCKPGHNHGFDAVCSVNCPGNSSDGPHLLPHGHPEHACGLACAAYIEPVTTHVHPSEVPCYVDCPANGQYVGNRADRGEFGMPTIGADAARMIAEVRSIHLSRVSKVDRVCNIMDEAQTLYKRKAAGYRGVEGDTADHLGAKGQFADINRKFWRLKAMIWDEVVEPYPDAGMGESVEEVLMDFIGHAALTIDFLRENNGQGSES